jgi:hypothetical protein
MTRWTRKLGNPSTKYESRYSATAHHLCNSGDRDEEQENRTEDDKNQKLIRIQNQGRRSRSRSNNCSSDGRNRRRRRTCRGGRLRRRRNGQENHRNTTEQIAGENMQRDARKETIPASRVLSRCIVLHRPRSRHGNGTENFSHGPAEVAAPAGNSFPPAGKLEAAIFGAPAAIGTKARRSSSQTNQEKGQERDKDSGADSGEDQE